MSKSSALQKEEVGQGKQSFTFPNLESSAALVGGLAHFINNQMAGILGYAELLQMDLADNPKAAKMLEAIGKAAIRTGELTHQMLAFAGKNRVDGILLDLNDAVVEAIENLAELVSPSIHLSTELERGLWSVKADNSQMIQMLTNILKNAVEAIETDGKIRISTRNMALNGSREPRLRGLSSGPYVRLTIRDNGSGMSPDIMNRAFEPFFTTKFLGRGLGLSAVYGIVKRLEGTVTLDGAENQGTTVSIYLPAEIDPTLTTSTLRW